MTMFRVCGGLHLLLDTPGPATPVQSPSPSANPDHDSLWRQLQMHGPPWPQCHIHPPPGVVPLVLHTTLTIKIMTLLVTENVIIQITNTIYWWYNFCFVNNIVISVRRSHLHGSNVKPTLLLCTGQEASAPKWTCRDLRTSSSCADATWPVHNTNKNIVINNKKFVVSMKSIYALRLMPPCWCLLGCTQ